jgi:hypothetical protein
MQFPRQGFAGRSPFRHIVPRRELEILLKSQGMSQVSTARKMGIAARVAARVAAQHAGRSRTVGAVTQGVRATASHFGRVLHQLWMEITGFIFLAFAGIGAIALVREYLRYTAGKSTSGHVLAAAVFTVMFGWFGVSSFWRVRKKAGNHARK